MDGTLTKPTLDFAAIRREIGLPEGDLLDMINDGLPPAERKRAWAIVEAHEERAAAAQELQEGAAGLVARCRAAGVLLGLLTRNSRRSVDRLCRKFGMSFDAVVTREFAFVKPHPEPVRHILRTLGTAAAETLTVGDYIHDINCGRAAGTATCFFHNPGGKDYGARADFAVRSMAELDRLIFP
jgi:HAD superfamily hydrolase (TIGR01549 family)